MFCFVFQTEVNGSNMAAKTLEIGVDTQHVGAEFLPAMTSFLGKEIQLQNLKYWGYIIF